MTKNDLLAKVTAIEGWMGSTRQMDYMYELASATKVAGEVGTYKGKSAVLAGVPIKANGGVYYCVDTFSSTNPEIEGWGETFSAFQQAVKDAELESTCLPIRGFSFEVYDQVPATLEWVYIDGDHEPDGVTLDILAYHGRVLPGGLMLFHDYGWVQIQTALQRAIGWGYLEATPLVILDDFGVHRVKGEVSAEHLNHFIAYGKQRWKS